MRINKFRITAQKIDITKNDEDPRFDKDFELQNKYLLSGTTRGFADEYTIDMNDDTIAEFVFEDNTVWLCGRDTISDLFPDLAVKKRASDEIVRLPSVLKVPGAGDRGLVSGIAIKLINIFLKKQIGQEVERAAKKFELRRLNNLAGLFRLDEEFQLQNVSTFDTTQPILLLLHGTASSTDGSFGEMKGTDLWRHIVQSYGKNILAFQHKTLTESPLDNVKELVEKLPNNCTLHIISHSRGGLIGDLLCRFTSSSDPKNSFTQTELERLKERADDAENIKSIMKTLQGKNLNVRKFVRVACPAAGTTLASKRMDIYFNVIGNVTGLLTGAAANPFFSAFKTLLATVIQSKNNVDVLPGIEAMNPESPFIKILNSPAAKTIIDTPLAVVSGNCGVDFSLKGLKVLASKLFFLQNNDLVVNSESMYLGSKRKDKVQFFFDHGDNVDHFHYFSNKKTTDAILLALKSEPGEPIPGFEVFDPTSTKQLRKLEGGVLLSDTITGKRSIVILLPGIMGSNIGDDDDLTWINYGKFLTGGLMDMNDLTKMKASSLVNTAYGDLKAYLSEKYDVRTYPFDWRKSLSETALEFEDEVKQLMKFRQPIKIVAHSMGGVLVRDFMVLARNTWEELQKSKDFRLVFLGSPLGGSFRIPNVIFGKDSIIKKLALIDICHNKQTLIGMFSQMPGLISLLPFDKIGGNDMTDKTTWEEMRRAFGDSNWPVPNDTLLKDFRNHREVITKGIRKSDYDKAVYIAGKDKATPMGYLIEEDTNGSELIFLSTSEGDQSVTWESGIPKTMIDNDSVYYVNATHGELSFKPSLFKGIGEILEQGATNLFSKKRPLVRGEEKVFETPDINDFDLSQSGITSTILGIDNSQVRIEPSESPVHVTAVQGDLLYSKYPVMAGHFEGDAILFAEEAINKHLGGVLGKRHQLSLYPGLIGTSEVVISSDNSIHGAVIVGLGRPGELTAYRLTTTVEQGVSNYLLTINSSLQNKSAQQGKTIGITSLIIGCGYGGLSIENSVRAIVEGVQNANNKVRNLFGKNCPVVDEIEFIERYEDRALACFHSLSRIESEQSRNLNIVNDLKTVRTVMGSVRRMPNDATDSWWNRITVKKEDSPNEENNKDNINIQVLKFSASTGGAREENEILETNTKLIEKLIDDISTRDNWSPSLAKTIFELMIPNNFKEQLKKQCNISWILDIDTAAYPWELLQDNVVKAKPLCINAGMIRQLATDEYRAVVNMVTKNNALVISSPELNGFAPDLPGALMEGEMVSQVLTECGFEKKHIAKGGPSEIIKALFEDDYKILHLSGHGMYNEASPLNSGMLIGENVFLTSRQITQVSSVPEFVFINCCFLGKEKNIGSTPLYKKRSKLAASIGTELIKNGVKAVIAAGWAINDDAALEFARVFYSYLFDGETFGNAVLQARKSIYEKFPGTNAWGAYQCYGDPYYQLNTAVHKRKNKDVPKYVIALEADYDLYNLHRELEMGQKSVEEILIRLNAISDGVDKAELRNASITEKEAMILRDLALYKQSIAKFETLLKLENADFSFASMEKYCNIRTKSYVQQFIETKDTRLAATIDEVIEDVNLLLTRTGETAERHNILASALKRKAFIVGPKAEKIRTLKEACIHYYAAALKSVNEKQIYPITNWLALETILDLHNTKSGIKYDTGLTPEIANERLDYYKNKIGSSPEDYWSLIAIANIQLNFLLSNQKNRSGNDEWDKFSNNVSSLWKKAGSPGMKSAEIENMFLLENALTLEDIAQATTPLSYKIALENINEYVERLKQALTNSGSRKTRKSTVASKANITTKKAAPERKNKKSAGRKK